jgi:hypothetical protein
MCIDDFDYDYNGDNSLSYSDNLLEQFLEEEEKRFKQDKRVLREVESSVSKTLYEDILLCLDLSDYTYNYRITETPIGKYQEESDYEELKGYYVEQNGGGMTGDDFQGTISIQIENTPQNKKFFTFDYNS